MVLYYVYVVWIQQIPPQMQFLLSKSERIRGQNPIIESNVYNVYGLITIVMGLIG